MIALLLFLIKNIRNEDATTIANKPNASSFTNIKEDNKNIKIPIRLITSSLLIKFEILYQN